jgi:rare lipoprotein A
MKIIIAMCVWCVLTSFKASYYHSSFHGKTTYSGEIYNENKLTAASNVYPIGTRLKITNIENNKSVIVKINDKGSFRKVSIDLSKKAFSKIAELDKGVVEVKIKVIR